MKAFVPALLALAAVFVRPIEAKAGLIMYGPDYEPVNLLVPLSPYDESSPRFYMLGFELLTETEVDPYRPVAEREQTPHFKGGPGFWTSTERLAPPDWGSNFRILRDLDKREFCLQRQQFTRYKSRFNEQEATRAITNAIKAEALAEAERKEKALWDRTRKRVASALKKANADGATKKKALQALKKARLEVSKQQAQLRDEIERLEQDAEER
jgi:hypothetical protein